MTFPLVILAVFSVTFGFLGTPAWGWFEAFVEGGRPVLRLGALADHGTLAVMCLSTVIVFSGLALGYWFYGRTPPATATQVDALERLFPNLYTLLRRKYFVDEIYDWLLVRRTRQWAALCDWADRWLLDGLIQALSLVVVGLSWLNRLCDDFVLNLGFDTGCRSLQTGGDWLSRWQNGWLQRYLRLLGLAVVILVLMLVLGCRVL